MERLHEIKDYFFRLTQERQKGDRCAKCNNNFKSRRKTGFVTYSSHFHELWEAQKGQHILHFRCAPGPRSHFLRWQVLLRVCLCCGWRIMFFFYVLTTTSLKCRFLQLLV